MNFPRVAWFLRPTLWLAFILSSPLGIHAQSLRVGVARVDITPTEPVRLAGYQSRTNLSQGVHDPLSGRAVAFESNGRRLVLVSTDVLGFYGTSTAVLREAILDTCGLEPSELFLSAVHTHSAPTVTFDSQNSHSNNVAYSKILQGKLVEVVQTALAGLRPAHVGFGSGASPVGSNRRERVTENAGGSRIVLGRNPDASIDREVQVLEVTKPETGEPAAVLFAYATHSTALGPRNYLISGDVHGLAEQFLERYLGSSVVAAGFAGASGDIDPWYRVLPEFKVTNDWLPEPVLLGTLLGEEVVHVLDRPQKTAVNGSLRSLFQTVELPGKTNGASVSFNITVACLGDVAFVGLGGEVFNEIGRAIKTASPFPYSMIMTHCNGSAGYLPTRDAYDAGGYEVQSSRFGPAAAERVAAAATGMLKQLRRTPE